jgi:hypothetical protein
MLNVQNVLKGLKFSIRDSKLQHIHSQVLEVDSIEELRKIFGWKEIGDLCRDDIYDYEFAEDLNQRRVRDAEVIANVMKNVKPKNALEIGTSTGLGTSLMAGNAPDSTIYTINIPPEEIISGAGGVHTTHALETEKIGSEYRKRGHKNVKQIFANTLTWQPDLSGVEVAFIDGCHDTDFVVNDTIKVLKTMKPGSFIMWHDFNPELVHKFGWIFDVCFGVEKLYEKKILTNRIYHLKNSWIGLYRV